MTYQIVDWLITYIECFVMLVVVTESGGRKFEEKKQAYLLLSFSLLNAILVAVCNQISAFSFITPVLSILYLTVISRILSRGNFLLRISISITTMFIILSIDYIFMVVFCWIYGGDQFSTTFNVLMTPGPLRCLYLILDKSNGKQYVGSTYSSNTQKMLGIWNRWAEYADTGHGGNKSLEALCPEGSDYHKKNFQWTILEVLPLNVAPFVAIERESFYKKKFGTAEPNGYNNN